MATDDEQALEEKPKKAMTAGQRLAAAKAAKAAKKATQRGKDAELAEDKVVKQAAEASRWAHENQKTIVYGIIGGFAVIALVIFGQTYLGGEAAAASNALWDATETAGAAIRDEDAPAPEEGDDTQTFETEEARSAAALEAYRTVIAGHEGSSAAVWARLGEATTLFRQGENEAARTAFEQALSEGGDNPTVAARALEGIAFTYEVDEAWDDAITRFEELSSVGGAPLQMVADYHMARMMLAKGEDVRAKEKLRTLVEGLREEGSPDLAYVRDQAELALLELDPTAVSRAPENRFGGPGGPGGGPGGLGGLGGPPGGAGGPPGGPGGGLSPEQLQQLIQQLQQKQGAGGGGLPPGALPVPPGAGSE